MKVDRLTKSLIFIGFIVLLVGLYFYVSPYVTSGTRTDSIGVQPWHTQMATIQLSKGDTSEGYFTVRGGNDNMKFSIKDPYGSVILDAGTVTGRRDFAFTAQFSGAYTAYFDNSFPDDKTVYFSYSGTYAAFPRDLTLLIALLGFLIMLLGLARVGQAWAKEKQKQQAPHVPPPPP